MVYCCGQASICIDVSEVMQELLISDLSNGDYTQATCHVGLIHPCCHPQSKIGKFASTKQYHMVFINGTDEHDGYNYGFMNYEAPFRTDCQQIIIGIPFKLRSTYHTTSR
jgi:hypothetical protein